MLALIFLAGTFPAMAEGPAAISAVDGNPFRALAEIKTRDDIWERSFDSLYEQMRVSFQQDSSLARGDKACPGLIDAVAGAARPIMHAGHYIQRRAFRDGLTKLFAEGLTADQAREAYDFYASDDGRYLLELGTDSSSQQAKIAQGTDPIDRKAFNEDYERTHAAIHRNVDPAVEKRVEARLAVSSWYAPYLRLHARIQQLRYAISRDKSLLPPDNREQIELASRRATTLHLVQCKDAMNRQR